MHTILHIGFPKTGTTTLQNHLFSRHPGIHYLGKPYTDPALKKMMNALVMEESTVFQASPLKDYLNKQMAGGVPEGKNVVLLSEETLVSAAKVRDKGVVAHRLQEVFGPCKILVTIRNQMEAVKSAYINGGRYPGNLPERYKGAVISINEWLEISEKMYHGDFIRNVIYFDTIDYYARLFGKDNICVLLFEDFVKNKPLFIEKLSRFLGVDSGISLELTERAHDNKRLSQGEFQVESIRSSLGVLRNVTPVVKLLYAARRLWGTGKRSTAQIPEKWRQRLWDLYKDGNRKLMENYHLPLERCGYPV